MKTLRVSSIVAMLALLVLAAPVHGQLSGVVPGASVNGLRLAIGPADSAPLPSKSGRVVVTLTNEGSQDFVLNLGSMLANGRVMFPEAISLLLTGPDGVTVELRFQHFRYPAIAGRLDDFVVSLRSGSSYNLLLSLDDYSAWKLEPGTHRIRARFSGEGAKRENLDMRGVALLKFWTGVVESDAAEFRVAQSHAEDDCCPRAASVGAVRADDCAGSPSSSGKR